MLKGFSGLLVAFLIGVALLGAIMWGMQQESHDMVLEPAALQELIDQQRSGLQSDRPDQ